MTPAVTVGGPALFASPNPSPEGAYRVSWAPIAGASKYQLYEDGKLSYRGADLAHAYSDKTPGTYTYTLTYCVTALSIEACNFRPALAGLRVQVSGGDAESEDEPGAP